MTTRKVITHIVRIALAAGVTLVLIGVAQAGGNIDSTNKYAWGTNVGWINFNPTHGGVTVYPDHLEGYAWGENIGWIRLGTCSGSPCTHLNTTAANYGVNRDGSGNLSGYAWGTNVGWINFSPTHGGVTINTTTGDFDGYAWGENIGWIHFQNTSPAYKVQTLAPTAVNLATFTAAAAGSSVEVTWQTTSEVDTRGFNVWRSLQPVGGYEQLNAEAIPARDPGGWSRNSYHYVDRTVLPGRTYYYRLEVIALDGSADWAGPVSVSSRLGVYLPMVYGSRP